MKGIGGEVGGMSGKGVGIIGRVRVEIQGLG